MDLVQDPSPAALLRLPVELRLLIYSFVIIESSYLTISSAEITGPYHGITERLYGAGRSPFPGLPRGHEPVVKVGYQPELLSATTPPTISLLDDDDDSRPSSFSYQDILVGHRNLLLVNRQVHAELVQHCASTRPAEDPPTSNLFIQYPLGLHVFRTLTPDFLQHARTIRLAGIYHPTTFSSEHRANLPSPALPESVRRFAEWKPDSKDQLRDLLRQTFGDSAPHPIAKFEMRIYYTGSDSYSTAWGDDRSPLVVALSAIGDGQIQIAIWRGRLGTGVYLSVTPSTGNVERADGSVGGVRAVSTVWHKLREGGRGEPKEGSWVVDLEWPGWGNGAGTEGQVSNRVVTW